MRPSGVTNRLAWTIIYLAPIAPGLITKAFFDTLTGNATLSFSVWGLIALLIGAAF